MSAAHATAVSLSLLLGSAHAYAACTPPESDQTTDCISCGNLEQNVARGHDLAWNEYLRNTTMQFELRINGMTRVHLLDPPHASAGVLFYTVVIEDPQFQVTDTASHATASELLQQWQVAFSWEGSNVQAEWYWRQHQGSRIEDAASTAVSTGSAPLLMRLFDSRGNAVTGGTVEWPRLTPQQQLALVGPRDLDPDPRYANDACASQDPRSQSNGTSADDYGDDDRGDEPDAAPWEDPWWDWEESYGLHTRYECVPDFSDPAGSGVICFG